MDADTSASTLTGTADRWVYTRTIRRPNGSRKVAGISKRLLSAPDPRRVDKNDLFIEFGPGGYGSADSLLDAGVMDSLALVRLLLWIEETFGVDLDFANLDPADIDSVDKIVARLDAHR